MGRRGPARKPDAALSSPRRASRDIGQPGIIRGVATSWEWPDADPAWSTSAMMTWTSAISSGQTEFYQASDVATLWRACHLITVQDRSPRPSAHLEASIQSMLSRLLVTVADRRQYRIDLLPEQDEAPVLTLESLGIDEALLKEIEDDG